MHDPLIVLLFFFFRSWIMIRKVLMPYNNAILFASFFCSRRNWIVAVIEDAMTLLLEFFSNLPWFFVFISGDKPHSCELCHKKFALACNLRAHMKTHEGKCLKFFYIINTDKSHLFKWRVLSGSVAHTQRLWLGACKNRTGSNLHRAGLIQDDVRFGLRF